MYKLDGITHETLKDLHDFFMPHTIITSSLWDKEDELYDIILSNNAKLVIDGNDLIIHMKNEQYIIFKYDFVSLTVI